MYERREDDHTESKFCVGNGRGISSCDAYRRPVLSAVKSDESLDGNSRTSSRCLKKSCGGGFSVVESDLLQLVILTALLIIVYRWSRDW